MNTRENISMTMTIRSERIQDIDAIARLTQAAFEQASHTSHTEQFIVDALRRAGQLTVSLVAVENDAIVGHIAASPVTVSSGATGWYGIGPVSVRPDRQGQGIGAALTKAALTQLQHLGGAGCVVLGDPGYYGRFGFQASAGLTLPGVAPEYFQALAFSGEVPEGVVAYHEAFGATE